MRNIITRRQIHLLLLAGLFHFNAVVVKAENGQQASQRETVLDRKVHIERELLDVPNVPRLCDGMNIQKNSVNIGDCELYCELEGDGTPIVLLHGGPGGTHHYFHPFFSQVKNRFKVIYYDQRGCGLSQFKERNGYSIDQAVEDLEHLRQALKINKWIVLGHSYGGTLAQCYVLKHPEYVAGLILVDSAFYGLDIGEKNTRQYEYISSEEKERIRQIRQTPNLPKEQLIFNIHLNGDWKRQNFYKPTLDELVRLARYEWVQDVNFRSEISQSIDKLYIEGMFKDCPIPTLLLEGGCDLTWGKDKPEKFHTCFPNSKLVIFEQSGHSPFHDEPNSFFNALKDFADHNLPQIPDSNISRWKAQIEQLNQEIQKSPRYLLKISGWGPQSSQIIAQKYSQQWLTQVNDPILLLKAGFALYDAKRYEEALEVFRKMSVCSRDKRLFLASSIIWQGHMLDLLGRRQQAITVYEKAVRMNVNDSWRHDQYHFNYMEKGVSEYAAERIKTPFTRIENDWKD
jgi:proline iminopeptidase